ncbi:glycosyltransferase family 9 protein [Mycolicibacterium cosmeticum]|uniref:glycosyltransferase family 9 protein n=1 Tax=Mycolicibacterium cosmeticum TaxID=258533 RepID=UPI001D0CD191|nr:glycosyltransferase family 9 protein [Mycolicibacterium cosmeticum]
MAVTAADPVEILVLRALGLGDLLTGFPALRALRKAHPGARIVLATPEHLGPLARLSRAIDDIEPTPGLGRLRPRRRRPDLAVNLHGCGPQSIADLLGVQPRSILTHRHPDFPDLPGPPWRTDVHEVQRWCALLEWAGMPGDPDDLGIERPEGFPDRSGVVVVHPGAGAAARRWPEPRFAEVAAALHDEGHTVVITGSADERELADGIARHAGLPPESVLAGGLELLDLVALISDSRLVICGDTGVGHIASATGTPSVLLFGPTPPQHWGPPGTGRHIVLWAGDRGDPHAEVPHSGLLLITVQRVLDAGRTLLRECA